MESEKYNQRKIDNSKASRESGDEIGEVQQTKKEKTAQSFQS